MTTIKRYDMVDSYSGAWMTERPDGEWVDYDAAHAEIERLKADLREHKEAVVDRLWLDMNKSLSAEDGALLTALRERDAAYAKGRADERAEHTKETP